MSQSQSLSKSSSFYHQIRCSFCDKVWIDIEQCKSKEDFGCKRKMYVCLDHMNKFSWCNKCRRNPPPKPLLVTNPRRWDTPAKIFTVCTWIYTILIILYADSSRESWRVVSSKFWSCRFQNASTDFWRVYWGWLWRNGDLWQIYNAIFVRWICLRCCVEWYSESFVYLRSFCIKK